MSWVLKTDRIRISSIMRGFISKKKKKKAIAYAFMTAMK